MNNDYFNALGVKDRIISSLGNAVQNVSFIQDGKAKEHMLYGVSRRLRLLLANMVEITSIASVQRKKPLNEDEQTKLSLHLNSLYLHIRGCLDNLAWCLIYEYKLLDIDNKEEYEIGQKANMFGDKFLEQLSDVAPKIVESLKDKLEWNSELKKLRDPVAHRIPIYAVPALLDINELDKYKKVSAEANTALSEGNYELSGRLFKELNNVGDYEPYFAYSPTENNTFRKVYPKVGEDITEVLDIIDVIIDHIFQRGTTTG